MTTKERNAMMYRIIKDMTKIDFKIGFFSLTDSQIYLLAQYAELFKIKPHYGKSTARTLYDRISEHESKIQNQ